MSKQLSWIFLFVGCLISRPIEGHLLNMTEVQADIGDNGRIEVVVRIDLSKEFETSEAYFDFSKTDPAAVRTSRNELWSLLANSIDIQVDSRKVPLAVESVAPPKDVSLEDFKNAFVWPRTEVVLSGQLLSGGGAMQITFLPEMNFEEPIALSMRSIIDGKSKSRWLVADQSSPVFVFANDGTVNQFTETKSADRFDAFRNYLVLGFKHILPGGLDHLLFVLGIFLATRTLRPLILQISIFTIAHTITLGLAAYRIIEPPSQLVEILIAVSILWIGIENIIRPKQTRTRLWLIGGFGLLHGMGFASALSGLDLPTSDFLLGLLGFNIGVEIGQLNFIVLLLLLIGWFRNRAWYFKRLVVPASLCITLTALVWTIQRL